MMSYCTSTQPTKVETVMKRRTVSCASLITSWCLCLALACGEFLDRTAGMLSSHDDLTVGVHRGSGSDPRKDNAKAEELHVPHLQSEYLNFTTESFLQCLSQDANLTFAVTEGIITLVNFGRNSTNSEEIQSDIDVGSEESYYWSNDDDDYWGASCSMTVIAAEGWVWRMRFHRSPPIFVSHCDIEDDGDTDVVGTSAAIPFPMRNCSTGRGGAVSYTHLTLPTRRTV